MDQVRQRKTEIVDDVYITRLLKSGDVSENRESPDQIKGAFGIDLKKKEIVRFECKSLILCRE